MQTSLLSKCLGVSLAWQKCVSAPMFSADYWHSQNLLENEIARLKAHVKKNETNLYPYFMGFDYSKLDEQTLRHFALDYARKHSCNN